MHSKRPSAPIRDRIVQRALFNARISGVAAQGRDRGPNNAAYISKGNTKKGPAFARPVQSGADNGARTRDPNLGKVVLYQLSHVRKWWAIQDLNL